MKSKSFISFGVIFLTGSLVYGIGFRRIMDITASFAIEKPLALDTDHDGRMNLILDGNIPNYNLINIWEYNDYDRYILEDTVISPLEWAPTICDLGYLDTDSLVDMVGNHNGIWPYFLYVYESPNYNSNPINIVWQDSGFSGIYGSYITDLDQDGAKEILFGYYENGGPRTCIYENAGDNQYTLVWKDTTYPLAYSVYGDFDQDGKMDFITGNGGEVLVWEYIGDNDYQLVFRDTLPHGNNNDVFSSVHDMDGNGKPEFLFTCVSYLYGIAWLYLHEATGDDNYDFFLVDSIINLPFTISWQKSCCGDIDCDGRNEIIWSTFNQWHIYKATGVHQYEKIYSENWTVFDHITINSADLNGNGYPEVIESWGQNEIPPHYGTTIWEIEGVHLIQPNYGYILHPAEEYPIIWQKFDPPGADSFSIFFSSDSGVTYDTIVTGLGADDTVYMWTIPDVISENCKIMIWAYGPPRPGEQQPRGVAWDFGDFKIRPLGIKTDTSYRIKNYTLKVSPNPFQNHCVIKFQIPILHQVQDNSQIDPSPFSSPHRGEGWGEGKSQTSLKIYDATGRLVRDLSRLTFNVERLTVLWDGSDDSSRKLPAGVYFVRLDCPEKVLMQKVVKLK